MKTNNMANDHHKKAIYSTIATHPGEVLKDEIEARELVKSEVAQHLGIQPSHLSEFFKGKRNMSAALAVKLEDYLGISAEFWLTLQNRHDITLIRQMKYEHA